jgi:hydroxymethylbilane synthase
MMENEIDKMIGTRESQLAMVQAHLIQQKLKLNHPELTFGVLGMTTTGDNIQDVALSKVGTKALFTKELQIALTEGQVDLVVHSLKDLTTTLNHGLVLAAVSQREDPRDVIVMSPRNKAKTLSTLPPQSVIGTSSVRRSAQLKRIFPLLTFKDIRGNLNTRLSKLDNEDSPYDAICLAYAGIYRLGMSDRISEYLDCILHAVGQGALGIECRENDVETISLVKVLNHFPTQLRCIAERSFMRVLEGGCSIPLGVFTILNQDATKLTLMGSVTSLDGTVQLKDERSIDLKGDDMEKIGNAEELGAIVAGVLVGKGAMAVLESIRK